MELLKPADAAKLYKVTVRTLRRLIEDGAVPGKMIGGNYRVQPPAEEILTIGEVARELSMCEVTVRTLRDKGTIKMWKLGGNWRVNRSELERVKSMESTTV
jgi:excisionase family DNA binding protein